MIAILSAVVAVLAAGEAFAASAACQVPTWRLMYRHDGEGQAIAGSKDMLLTALRRGDPVRVAWGGAFKSRDGSARSVEHSADPVFVSITGGREVVAQLPEHLAQASYSDEAAATFGPGAVMWRGLLSTTGRFDAIWVDRATGREVRRAPQRAAVAWLAFAPDPSCDSREPLALALEGGVRSDEPPAP